MIPTKSKDLLEALRNIGIVDERKLIEHLPRRYESYAYTAPKTVYEDKERIVVLGRLRGSKPRPFHFSGRTLYRFYFETTGGQIFLIEAWNRAYLGAFFEEGCLYTLVGSYQKTRHTLALINLTKGEVSSNRALRPVYCLPSSISGYRYQQLALKCLSSLEKDFIDDIPDSLRKKYRLIPLFEAYQKAHSPSSMEDVHQALRTLKYREALHFELRSLAVKGANRLLRKDHRRKVERERLRSFVSSLPCQLTHDQIVAINECVKDMDSQHVMYRLLQGDVGTGKTLVAAILAYANHLRSEQTALMAPTDALARQHYETFRALFEGTTVKIALLTGGLSGIEKHQILEDIADGTIDIVIGTHALFAKAVNYAYLGLAIIDEQHKFGVNQRSLLLDKGEHADLLLMSATPIPRTLTLTLYGDLDVSTLGEFPSGRREVETLVYEPNNPKIREIVAKSATNGHRVYIVAPQIHAQKENSSVLKTYDEYEKAFPNLVAMLHGQMEEEEKEAAIASFKNGTHPILVATSLIEVGIDVKEANAMIVYSPTSFSLSSLHQLRGRIGRDGSKAKFVLAYEPSGEDDFGPEKIAVIANTLDGFKIAEEDLRLRGPGEIAGTKQSGLPAFSVANVIDDFKIFECARDDAAKILEDLDAYENRFIVETISSSFETTRLPA